MSFLDGIIDKLKEDEAFRKGCEKAEKKAP